MLLLPMLAVFPSQLVLPSSTAGLTAEELTLTLTLTASQDDVESVIAFKVRTNVPKLFGVKPVCGLVLAGETIAIKLVLKQQLGG